MYKYINQLDPQNEFIWGHLDKEVKFSQKTFRMNIDLTISKNGCGLCSLAMVIENLTGKEFPLVDVVTVAEQWNYAASGPTLCEMKVLAPVAAEMFGLRYASTCDADELLQWIRNGGMAIAHSAGDRPGHVGIMTSGAHYVAVVAAEGRNLTVLDPSQTLDKFGFPGRKEYVTVNGNELYIDYEVLTEDCVGKIPRYYMFAKRD